MRFLTLLVSCLLSCVPIFGKNKPKRVDSRTGRENNAFLILYKQNPQDKTSTHNAHGSHMAHASHSSHISAQHVSHYSSSSSPAPAKVVIIGRKKVNSIDTAKLKQMVSKGSGLTCKDIQVQKGFLQTFENIRVEQKCYIIEISFGANIYKYYVYGKMIYYFVIRDGYNVDCNKPMKVKNISWLEEIIKILRK